MDKTTQNLETNPMRLLMLGISSMVLTFSVVMAVFAPFPISLASVLYGRRFGYVLGGLCLVIFFVLSVFVFQKMTPFILYSTALVVSIAITEIVVRGLAPVKSMVKFGLGLILLIAGCGYYVVKKADISVNDMVLAEVKKGAAQIEEQKEQLIGDGNSEETMQLMSLLSQPQLLTKEIIKSAPAYFFISIFFILWSNLFLVLKSRRILYLGRKFRYTELSLLNFKVPENVVYLLIVSLCLAIWGNEIIPDKTWPADVGMTLIKCMGLFYFFQGFGIYVKFLDFTKVSGIFRTFIVMITVLMASWLLALVGLFDLWFDFRNMFKVKKEK
ncbi:MAG: DUF2232 domain-containing protein [Bacteriovoracaceae bacterium]|nr:DUF2232 domain-containing protein [Bacteriovoracaceae bacterium]